MAEYRVEPYIDDSLVPVCLTIADTFWPVFFFISSISIFFLLPLAILVILYSVIAMNLMTHSGMVNAPLARQDNASSALRYRKQVILMLGTVVIFFFFCLLPFRALTLWIIIVPHEDVAALGFDGYYSLLFFSRLMFCLNSAINPILYNLMSSKFRNGFLKLCGLKKGCFHKHKRILLRNSTFNTSSLTGITTSSLTTSTTSRSKTSGSSRSKNRSITSLNRSFSCKKTQDCSNVIKNMDKNSPLLLKEVLSRKNTESFHKKSAQDCKLKDKCTFVELTSRRHFEISNDVAVVQKPKWRRFKRHYSFNDLSIFENTKVLPIVRNYSLNIIINEKNKLKRLSFVEGRQKVLSVCGNKKKETVISHTSSQKINKGDGKVNGGTQKGCKLILTKEKLSKIFFLNQNEEVYDDKLDNLNIIPTSIFSIKRPARRSLKESFV